MGAMITLLDEAYAAGLSVNIDGDKLVVRGPRRAAPIARKLLDRKSEVMAALASTRLPADPTEAANLRELYEERAAIRQHDGHWPRDLAERLAFAECVEDWCRRHPLLHDTAICAGCGETLAGERLVLADGAAVHFHGQQFDCLIGYGFARKRRAVKALAAMGLAPPPGWEPR